MAASFAEILESDQFTFLVGKEKTPIIVHAKAISATSEPIDRLMNGQMNEAKAQSARMSLLEVNDFIRFCEYAYRGDYTVPACDPVTASEANDNSNLDEPVGSREMTSFASPVVDHAPLDIPDDIAQFDSDDLGSQREAWNMSPARNVDGWGYSPPHSRKRSRRAASSADETPTPSKKSQMRSRFSARMFNTSDGPKAAMQALFIPRTNTSADQNFSPVLLAHARLYAFATVYLIQPLRVLALQKIHSTLVGFEVYTKRVGDIIELARFAYYNEDVPDRTQDGIVDELRWLVVEYIACEIDTIGKCKVFVDLMAEGGEFAVDFWGIAGRHLF